MKNYRTTICGLIMAAVLAVQPILETGVIDWKKIGYAALIAVFGYLVKDHNVTGV